MGGVNCPPFEATASIAAASTGEYPVFFIMGIVIVPVVATFATELPLIIAIAPLDTTATFAGPPDCRPKRESAIEIKTAPAFV